MSRLLLGEADMKKGIFRRLVLVHVLALLASGASAEISARLGHFMPEDYAQGVAMNRFAELAQKYTNNSINIKVYHSGTLGSDDKMLQALQAGTLEFYIGVLTPLSSRVKEIQIWDLPFMFADTREAYALLDGPSSKKIFEKLEPAGVVGLAWTGLGFRNLSNSKRPVVKASDIDGLKVRVMGTPVALETWKSLGANPTPMAISEVFTALEIKAIDGQENPLQNIYSNKFYEVQKYISLTNHVYTPSALVVSKKFWDKLSDADRAGVAKAAAEAGVYQRELLDKGEKEAIGKFEAAGVQVNSIPADELARIQEKVRPVITKFAPQIGEDFVKGFYAEIDKARAAR
jgi:tripartite ATP-independent transporter DctP family solute receptor